VLDNGNRLLYNVYTGEEKTLINKNNNMLNDLPTGYNEPEFSTYQGQLCNDECKKSECSHQAIYDENPELFIDDTDFSGADDEQGYANDR
jgi:hypothetical protein